MVKPTSMNDSQEICQYLLAGKAVGAEYGRTEHTEVASGSLISLPGATYSMNGNLQKISNSIFIATPESVELSGDFQGTDQWRRDLFSGMGNAYLINVRNTTRINGEGADGWVR